MRVTCDCTAGLCGYGLKKCGLNWRVARVCNEIQTRKTMSSFDWVGPKIERGQLMDVDGGELSEYRKMQLGNVSSVGGSYGPCPFQAWVQICKDCFVSSPPFIVHIFLKAFPLSLEVVIYITHLTCKLIIPFFMPALQGSSKNKLSHICWWSIWGKPFPVSPFWVSIGQQIKNSKPLA